MNANYRVAVFCHYVYNTKIFLSLKHHIHLPPKQELVKFRNCAVKLIELIIVLVRAKKVQIVKQ